MIKKATLSSARFVGILLASTLLIGAIGCSEDEDKEVNKCWYAEKVDLKEAIEQGKNLIDKYPENIEAYRCLAGAYDDAGYHREAYDVIKKAVEIVENKWLKPRVDLIDLYEEVGDYAKNVDVDKAIEYYEKGLEQAEKIDDIRVISLENDIGSAYYLKGDINKSLKYLRNALYDLDNRDFKYTGGINLLKKRIFIYSDLAMAYYKNKNNDLTEEYLQKTLSEEKNNIENIGYPDSYFIKIKIGDMCKTLEMYKCAEEHYLSASEIAKGQDNEYREALAYKYLADLYDEAKQKELAKKYYQHAYKIFKIFNADGIAEKILKKIENQEQIKS